MQHVVENKGKNIMYHQGTMIPVGESRIFEVPDAPAAVAAPENDTLGVLQSSPVKIIVAGLPSLTDDDLARLEGLESAAPTPRKGVMDGIAHERLQRADKKHGGGEA